MEVREMLMRWSPVREMVSLQRDLDRMLGGLSSSRDNGFGETGLPLVDVSETEHAYKLRALVPGMSKDDINVSFHENVLTISGEKKAAELPENARVIRSERTAGQFQRTLRLRKPVDVGKTMAHLENGVLELTLPLQEAAKPKQIEVSVS
jgi:HSP20 family protein